MQPGWTELRCTRCDFVLARVVPAPGMKIESLCRKCGAKDIREYPGVPIDIVNEVADLVIKRMGDSIDRARAKME